MNCTDGCVVCPIGYLNEGIICTTCTTSNCARCWDFVNCTVCKDGYYFVSSTNCTKCPDGVAKCTSADFAISCSSGYTSV